MNRKPLQIGDLKAKIPVVQGGMGVGISLSNLAAAVANEGGVGIISSAQIGFRLPDFKKHPFESNLEAMKIEFEKARKLAPHGILGFNIMVALTHYKEYVKKAVEVGADLIVSGAGLATELPEYVKQSKTKIAPIVSTTKAAKVILKFWDRKFKRTADMIVIEGPKAGGHLGFHKEEIQQYIDSDYGKEVQSIMEVVKEYEEKYESHIPIVLGGGIATKEQADKAFALGVDAIQVATRFITTNECDAADAYKKAYLNVKPEDVVLVDSPVGMPGRALNNEFVKRSKCEHIPCQTCLNCLSHCNPKEIPYCITEALIQAAKGDIDHGLLFTGANVSGRKKLESVAQVIDSLLK